MFSAKIYAQRRNQLRKEVQTGLILFPGNEDVSFNYPANTYTFRQDSSFLYFFGLDHPGLAAVMDLDNGQDWIFGNDIDIDDIIWMGKQPTIKESSLLAGVINSAPLRDLAEMIQKAGKNGRKIHYLPPYR